MSGSASCPKEREDASWWQQMVDASAESDKDKGSNPLSPGEKLESLLHLAARLPARYEEELRFPPLNQRHKPRE